MCDQFIFWENECRQVLCWLQNVLLVCKCHRGNSCSSNDGMSNKTHAMSNSMYLHSRLPPGFPLHFTSNVDCVLVQLVTKQTYSNALFSKKKVQFLYSQASIYRLSSQTPKFLPFNLKLGESYYLADWSILSCMRERERERKIVRLENYDLKDLTKLGRGR